MAPTAPTLINLPPPPSDPVTPSDIPGTPTSGTTSMSELSTVAIKDGHRGHLPHNNRPSAHPDAERADRISRLAGLERVTTVTAARASSNPSLTPSNLTPGASVPPPGGVSGYFDAQGNPNMGRERSTVGSASATGSVGGRTTWASGSGSDAYEADKMSDSGTQAQTEPEDMEMEMDRSSVGGMSDEGAGSLVGFGEGARTPARQSGAGQFSYGSPAAFGKSGNPITPSASGFAAGRETSMTPVNAQTAAEQQDARMLDGSTYDAGVVDTSDRVPGRLRGGPHGGFGGVESQRILNERLAGGRSD